MAEKRKPTVQSKVITDQVKISKSIEASVHELRADTHARLVARLAPVLADPGELPDFGLVQQALAVWLGHQRSQLAKADALVDRERREDSRLRARRDRYYQELVGELKKAQWMIESVAGPGWAADVLGLGTGLGRALPERLGEVAAQAVAELRNPDLAALAGLPADKNLSGSSETAAAAIEAAATRLQTVLDQLPPSLRRTQAALGAKREQSELLGREIQRVSLVIEGFYRLADHDFHADRLRPAQPGTSGGEEEEEGEGGTGTPEPVAETPPGDGKSANDDTKEADPAAA